MKNILDKIRKFLLGPRLEKIPIPVNKK